MVFLEPTHDKNLVFLHRFPMNFIIPNRFPNRLFSDLCIAQTKRRMSSSSRSSQSFCIWKKNVYSLGSIQNLYGFVLTNPPTLKSKHSGQKIRTLWNFCFKDIKKELKKSWIKNNISECTYFFLSLEIWTPEHCSDL